MKDTLKTAMILFIPIFIVLFFAMVAPEQIEKAHVSKSVPVTNVNYEVQSLVKTYELTECFEEESFDTNVCCSN